MVHKRLESVLSPSNGFGSSGSHLTINMWLAGFWALGSAPLVYGSVYEPHHCLVSFSFAISAAVRTFESPSFVLHFQAVQFK